MKRIAIIAGLAVMAACSKGDKTTTTDTTTVGGAVAPASDSTGAMSSGSNRSAATRMSDSVHMAAGSNMSDSMKMQGTGMGDTLKKKPTP
ncbi:MAG: hypothetical protein JJD97_03030 [Gemmatimonadaceae bacterium]|nr:hypothetical protein [Gemmatimonadaceae bacterium]